MNEQKHRHLSRRERKKLQNKKNLYHQKIFDLARKRLGQQRQLRETIDANNKLKKKKDEQEREKKSDDKKEIWSVQVSSIRNRLTGKKRISDERWNRFAGTEDGGGRGR